jgi:ribosomal protein S18 acetylase RimI-like enzyme
VPIERDAYPYRAEEKGHHLLRQRQRRTLRRSPRPNSRLRESLEDSTLRPILVGQPGSRATARVHWSGVMTAGGDLVLGQTGSGVAFRPAKREDSRRIAELFRISSDGVVDYVWMTLASEYPGLEPIEIGAIRYAREEGNLSYTNCVVAEREGTVIGQLCTYPVESSAEDPDEPVDPVLEPYGRLEMPGTLYISSLALLDGFRGMGLGTRMISIARDQARERGFDALSLLVFEQNTSAVKLYEREGFREVDRATVVPHPLINHTGDVILMTAPG